MADNFNWDLVISANTEHFDTAEKSIKRVQDLVVALGDSGRISEKSMKSLFLSTERQMDSLGKTASQSLSRQSQGWKQLQAEIRKTTQEIQENAKASVLQGSKDPLRSAVNQMPLGQAQTIVAADEASNATALSIARERIEMERRLQDARRESIRLDRDATDALHPLEAATERLTAAQARLVDAENRVSRAETSGDLQDQVGAYENLVRAKHEVSDATSHLTRVQEENVAGLPRLRYAMYDVAQTTGILTAAIGGLATGLITASAQYETAFTAVERTSGVTGDAVQSLRDDFLELAREIPQTFAEIANIGARGAQLGIATDQLKDFTEVVAQFVATSDTVTLDQAVEAFGRISNLLGDTDFNRIGSAITLVGVNAAATEAQIVKTTQELAPFATAVGLSTDATIALAAALGSLGQPPERARSAFLTLQRVMDNAIASGSDNLQAFANLLNVSADEVARLWKQDPDQFITAFARSLGSVEDLTTAFAQLGINERRAVQVFQALAADARNAGGELSVLERAMSDSAQGYAEGTELARQYGLIVDDLASKWQIFKNSVMELSATMGDVFAPTAKIILDIITEVIQALTAIARNPAGKFFIGFAGIVAGVAFALGTVITALALGTASIAAMRTAMDGLSRSAGTSVVSLRTLNTELTRMATGIRGGTTALTVFRTALSLTGITLLVSAIGALTTAFTGLGTTAEETFNSYVQSTAGLSDALQADLELMNLVAESGVTGLGLTFTELPPIVEDATDAVDDNREALENAAEILGWMAPAVSDVTRAVEGQTAVLGANSVEWFKASLAQNQAFQNLVADTSFIESWNAMGADFDTVIRIAAEQGYDGVINYFLALSAASEDGAAGLLGSVQTFFYRIGQTFVQFGQYLATIWSDFTSLFTGGEIVGAVDAIYDLADGLKDLWTAPVLQKGYREFARLAEGFAGTAREATASRPPLQAVTGDWDDFSESVNTAGDALGNTREAFRTVLDYASDLQGVFGRAFDLRFGVSIAQDSTANMLQKLRDEAEAAEQRIRDLRVSLRDLRSELGLIDADISKTQYFLSIAIEYGDTQRAEQLQAQLAKLEADRVKTQEDLRKKQNELTAAEEANSRAVQGNTQAARDNRATLQELFQSYREQIIAAAEAGASQKQLEILSQELRAEFVRQATQMGYNRADLKQYEQAFYDVSFAIQRVPRNVTLEIHGLGPAQAALREYEARIRNTMNNARNTVGNGINIPIRSSLSGIDRVGRGLSLISEIQRLQDYINTASASFSTYRTQQVVNSLIAQLRSGNYYTGGFTGRGGKYEPAGIVHKGEYVVPKHMVNQSTGLPYADALGRLVRGTPSPAGYANGGYVRPTPSSPLGSTVSLSAGTIQQIAMAVKPHLIIDGKMIAEAVSRADAGNNRVGAN